MKRFLLCAALALCIGSSHSADLSIGLGADVTSMDPHAVNLLPNNNIAEHIFDKLVHSDPRQRLIPGLAESWRAIDDTTWEFRLRKGVKFHDGSDFTAADVIFSLDRPKALTGIPGIVGGYITFTQAITEKIVVDPYTVRLKTATPYPNLPTDMHGLVMVSSVHAKDAHTTAFDSGKAAIGTGPYKLVRFVKGDRIELARNDHYWGPKSPWERVTFRILPDDPTRVATLLSGAVQMIENIPSPDFKALKKNAQLNVDAIVSNRMIHFHLDSARERTPFATSKAGAPLDKNPFRDVRVRRAISKAIDRQSIVDRVMEELALPAGQMVPPGFFGALPELKPEPYDPEGARKLLAEAGFPDGFALTVHGPNNRYVNDDQIVQTVAQMLSRVGIAAKVETMPMNIYLTRGHKKEFSMALLGWGVVTGEASYPLRALTATATKEKGWGTFNWGSYSNAKADAILDQALAAVDNARREKLLQQATHMLMQDYALIPVHFQLNTWALRKPLTYDSRTDERTYAHHVRPGK